MMTRTLFSLAAAAGIATTAGAQRAAPPAKPGPAPRPAGFTLEQVRSYPFPDALTAAATGRKLAWELNELGVRNVWVAEGPDFKARRLTGYTADDGQELTSIAISAETRARSPCPPRSRSGRSPSPAGRRSCSPTGTTR